MVRLAPSSIERPRERETAEMTGADAKQAEKQAFSGLFFFFGLMRSQKPEGQPLGRALTRGLCGQRRRLMIRIASH